MSTSNAVSADGHVVCQTTLWSALAHITAGRIKKIEKDENEQDSYTVLVEGLARIKLPRSLPPVLQIQPPTPLIHTSFSLPLPSGAPRTVDIRPLALRILPKQLHDRVAIIPQGLLSDLLVTVLGIDWEIRAEILGIPDTDARGEKVRRVLLDLMAKRGIDPPDQPPKAIGPSTALVQRNVRAPGMRQKPPENEDLAPLRKTLEARHEELSYAAEQAVGRELTRLASIPPQSAEYALVRNYVEWILALPWKKVSELGDEVDLKEARRRLDAEHEGLEGVKRRVVEYLAVYRWVFSFRYKL